MDAPPAVRASLSYGRAVKLKPPEMAVWHLRLLTECGLIDLASVHALPVPSDVRPSVRKVYEGFLLLLGCKWLHTPAEPTAFTWRFASAWCGVTERHAGEAVRELLRLGLIRCVDRSHGLLSKEVVIRVGDGKESVAEFQSLVAALWDDLQPIGVFEEMLVEKIAVCYWCLRRVLRCEVGEIRKETDTLESDEGCERRLLRTSAGTERLLEIVGGPRYDIKEHGRFCESAEDEMHAKLRWLSYKERRPAAVGISF